MRLQLDVTAQGAYASVPLAVAEWADRVFDWLEEDPINPHARAHRFTNGLWAVLARIGDDDWLVLWELDGTDVIRIRYLGENTLRV